MGPKKKSRGANINAPPAWWFSVVMKTDLLWLNLANPRSACEYRWNRRQKVFKSFTILLAESYLLYMSIKRIEREIKQKTGGPSRGQPKFGVAMAHPGPPLEPPLTVRTRSVAMEHFYLCDLCYRKACASAMPFTRQLSLSVTFSMPKLCVIRGATRHAFKKQ